MLKLPRLSDLDQNPALRIFLCLVPADMRQGFDSLAQRARDLCQQDPLRGHLFLFRSRGGERLKILYWDGDGFALWYKRLEEGTFRLPKTPAEAVHLEIKASDLAMLLSGIDLRSVRKLPRYQLPPSVPSAPSVSSAPPATG
jgi:transposase